jgi:hypothetical protein
MKQPNPDRVPMAPLCNNSSRSRFAVEISMSISLRQGEFRSDRLGFLNTSKISNIRRGCPEVIIHIQSLSASISSLSDLGLNPRALAFELSRETSEGLGADIFRSCCRQGFNRAFDSPRLSHSSLPNS